MFSCKYKRLHLKFLSVNMVYNKVFEICIKLHLSDFLNFTLSPSSLNTNISLAEL